MKRLTIILFLSALLLILPGCWSKNELTEFGLVMGVALDRGKDGNIDMITQVYRPKAAKGENGASSGGSSSNLNIKTSARSVLEAIRDIPIHLGRKAQFSHMRVIVIGEQLARTVDIGKLLDIFYRDHEPRVNVSLIIAKGSAGNLLKKQPIIEQTSGQQLLRVKKAAYLASSKTMDTSLLDLVQQYLSPHNDAFVSYVYEDKHTKEMFSAAGLALLKKGKMTAILSPERVKGLIMLRNEYNSGIIVIPCKGNKNETESVEILLLKTQLKPKLHGEKLAVSVTTRVDAAIGELKCTNIKTKKDEVIFIRKMEEELKSQMFASIRFLQSKKTDIIGIGNLIYRNYPQQFNRMKENWDDKFAEIPFDIQVKLRLITSGTVKNNPTLSDAK